jgi:hypothetical protein
MTAPLSGRSASVAGPCAQDLRAACPGEAYRDAARRRDFGDAWWSLANLKTYRFPIGNAPIAREEARASTAGRSHPHSRWQGAGGCRRPAGLMAALCAAMQLQRAQALSSGDLRDQHPPAEAVCTGLFAARADWGSFARPDFRARPAAFGFDPDRADPRSHPQSKARRNSRYSSAWC